VDFIMAPGNPAPDPCGVLSSARLHLRWIICSAVRNPALSVYLIKRRMFMRVSLVVAAAILSALALTACNQQPAVAPVPPVVVTVPGPAGPQGATGAPAEKGATGATGMPGAQGEKGKQGDDGAIVVVPAPASQR
jgi:hypothetical protein